MESIRKYRKLNNMSVIELAEKSSLHRDTIYKLERGESHARIDTLKKIATALDIPITALIS